MTRIKNVWKKVNYEVVCFIILAGSVFVNIDRQYVEPWDIYPYVGDYSHGIADKFLVGEIISWFTDFVSVDTVFAIAIPLGMVLCALLAIFSGQTIRHSAKENKTAVTVTVFALWLLPSGIGGLLRYIGVPDVFMALSLILCVILSKNRYALWAVPFISATAVGFHQIYTTLYFPTLFVTICFFALQRKNGMSGFIAAITTTLTTLASFVFITFFSGKYLTFENVEALTEYLNSKSDMNFTDDYLQWIFWGEYFADVKTYADGVFEEMLDTKTVVMSFAAFAPLFAVIFYTYFSAMRESVDKRKKFIFLLCSVSWVPTIATCFLMRNMFRIFAALWMTQFLTVSVFLYFKDEDFLRAFEKVKNLIIKYRTVALVYMIFILSSRKWI